MRIEVFVDEQTTPLEVLTPPEKFRLDTNKLDDGAHTLTFRAIDGDLVSVRRVSFQVQNGPAIAVHGIVDGDTLTGEVGVLTNAYGARLGDEFEPQRIETPAPVPTWAWVLCLVVLAWGAGYLSLENSNRIDRVVQTVAPQSGPSAVAVLNAETTKASSGEGAAGASAAWKPLGAQLYGINCSSCHQASGVGLPGVFPPLVGNAAVLDANPTHHISVVLNGLSGKEIDGVAYAAPMPPFGAALSDAEVAAVVNHERTQWGNDAALVKASDVAALR